MGYQERIAQYRAAWQRLQVAITELRREQPDPVLAHDTWRAATSYAQVFAHMLPSGLAESLRHAYAQMVADSVAETDRDLAELDRRLGELHRSLSEQLEAARGLVHGRVELVNGEIHAAVAALAAEVIQVREQARLEAMAFEI
jgi:Mg2+ and Co2+ transporter CorA